MVIAVLTFLHGALYEYLVQQHLLWWWTAKVMANSATHFLGYDTKHTHVHFKPIKIDLLELISISKTILKHWTACLKLLLKRGFYLFVCLFLFCFVFPKTHSVHFNSFWDNHVFCFHWYLWEAFWLYFNHNFSRTFKLLNTTQHMKIA